MEEPVQKRLDAFFDPAYKLLSATSLPENRLKTCEHIVPTVGMGDTIMAKSMSEGKLDTLQSFREESWDYVGADTQYVTHGLHPYPARMIPQIARKLIILYSKPGPNTTVLDPFMGSGGVLVESTLKLPSKLASGVGARKSFGIDINPLALLIAKVKVNPIKPESLKDLAEKLLKKVENDIAIYNAGRNNVTPPDFFNIDYWFKPDVKRKLQIIRGFINNIADEHVRDFFKVCFSKTVRECSNTRSSEFKLFRIPAKVLEKYNPDVFKSFMNNIKKSMACMKEYYRACEMEKWARPKILDEDTRVRTSIPDGAINLVVTSPPYGDSRTTVAYGQFSRLSMQWLDIDGERSVSVDKRSLGGIKVKTLQHDLKSETLSNTLDKIASKDEERVKDVLSFFVDLNKCLHEISRVMMCEGKVCIVIGNRMVKGIRIPTNRIIVELSEVTGLIHEITYERKIPIKCMPWENAPSNIPGEKEQTIHREHVVVFSKLR